MGKPELFDFLIFHLGRFQISSTVLTTWVLMAILAVVAKVGSTKLSVDGTSNIQTILEGVVLTLQGAIEDVAPGHGKGLLPFIGTLWLFIAFANLIGLIPGFSSPTGDLSLTLSLAMLVFFSVHWYGIRINGFKAYMRHYLEPNPILLPFHLLGEITRTLALAIRLFGNMMSLETAALLVVIVAGLFAPVPLLILHIVEALVQAYIFGMLSLVYIAGALQSSQIQTKE
jgi:F-type H+-transporting ATPase subunit a